MRFSMRNFRLSPRWLGLCAVAALTSCAQQSQPVPSAPGNHPLANGLFDEVNGYRLSRGAKPLQRHGGLDNLALKHSDYLRRHRGSFSLHGKNVSHYGSDARFLVAREGYGMASVSENVAASPHAGAGTPAAIVQLWKQSRDHHKNMTDAWTHSGMGVVVDSDGMIFATQIFAVKSSSQMTMRDRMNSF
jgi:uncharacterized protein YkwD